MVPFALVVGILAQGQGLSLLEITLMSALCYAGSAQLLALGHWGVPAPVLGAAAAAFVVNLRLALMGPVMGPWLDRVRGWRLWATLFVMADQNWALSVTEMQAGRSDAGFLFGSGALMWLVWVAFTAVGPPARQRAAAAAGPPDLLRRAGRVRLHPGADVARKPRPAALGGGGRRGHADRAPAAGHVVAHRRRRPGSAALAGVCGTAALRR